MRGAGPAGAAARVRGLAGVLDQGLALLIGLVDVLFVLILVIRFVAIRAALVLRRVTLVTGVLIPVVEDLI